MSFDSWMHTLELLIVLGIVFTVRMVIKKTRQGGGGSDHEA